MVNPLSAPATQPVLPAVTTWDALTEALRSTYEETSPRNWFILLGMIVAGLIAGQVFHKLFTALADRQRRNEREVRAEVLDAVAGPLSLFLLIAGVATGIGGIAMSDKVGAIALRVLVFLHVVVVGWFLSNLIDVLDLLLRRRVQTNHQLFIQAVPLVRKSLRLFLIIVLVLFTAQNVFGSDISQALAGLGIAGLAVTLAAQDSIKNFFGSITILLDRPFALGDYIVIDGYEGTVEEIGFRSTRVRRSEGSLVTIPNSKAVEQSISNFSRRTSIRRTLDLLIPYDTAVEKLREIPAKVKEILSAADLHKSMVISWPPQIRFADQKGDSLVYRVVYWHQSADRPAFYEHAQRVNLGLLDYFQTAQIAAKLSDVDVMMGKR